MKLIDWFTFMVILASANLILICLVHGAPNACEVPMRDWVLQDHDGLMYFLLGCNAIAFVLFLRVGMEKNK